MLIEVKDTDILVVLALAAVWATDDNTLSEPEMAEVLGSIQRVGESALEAQKPGRVIKTYDTPKYRGESYNP